MSLSKLARADRESMKRIARAEADCNATVLRAFHKVLTVLQREYNEALIRRDRKRKGVRNG